MSQAAVANLRRVLLVFAALVLVLAFVPGIAHGSHTAGFFYTVEVDGLGEQVVTPLVGTTDVVTFYDYGGLAAPSQASANTGLEKPDTSILFLYEDPLGNVSLVMIHDDPSDGTGGRVDFAFAGVPAGTSFVLRDDAAGAEAALPASTWQWNNTNTDGGVLSGTLNGAFAVAIAPSFPAAGGLSPGQISNWDYLDGTLAAPAPIPLDMTDTATVRARPAASVDVKPGSDPSCFNSNGNGAIPVAILSSASYDATQIDPATLTMDGQAVQMRGDKLMAHIEDSNGNGLLDLVVQFQDGGVYPPGDGTSTVNGQTFGGVIVFGQSDICVVPN